MEATIFVLHSAFFGFAVCKATSKEVRSSCATCAMGSGDWEVPLKIRWNAQSQDKELSDLIAPDSAESTSSTLVSDRVRRVLENE